MKSQTLPRFWQRYRDLRAEIQKAARDAYRRFASNPSHPGLYFHRIDSRPGAWSVRITLNYRAVGVLRGDTITWIWIGSHADFDRMFAR